MMITETSEPIERRAVDRERPNEETRRAIEEVESGIGLSRRFNTVDELMTDLYSPTTL